QLRAGAERFSGVLEVVVPDDDGTPTAVRQVVDVLPGESKPFTLYARPGSGDPEFVLRLYNQVGRRVAEGSSDALAKLDPLQQAEVLLTLGSPQGVELIPKLPGFNADAQNTPTQGRAPGIRDIVVARPDAMAGMLPGRWLGYDAVDAVVLDT